METTLKTTSIPTTDNPIAKSYIYQIWMDQS